MHKLLLWTLIGAVSAAVVATPIIGAAWRDEPAELLAKAPPRQKKRTTTKAKTTPSPTSKVAATALASPAARPLSGPAKYEPARGTYLGAALDYSKLSGGDAPAKIATIMGDYEKEVGREQAIFVQFVPFSHDDGTFPAWDKHPWGWSPPVEFCDAAANLGAAPLLTLEPFKPRLMVDGWKPGAPAYEAVKTFAQGAGAWKKPLFIRFAHEMNGSWYPWCEWNDKNRNLQRDPGEDTGFYAADYRQAYRNVALLFRQFAPNAALVWCPNSGLLGGGRRDVFGPFYPGDDVVDWVGLDIYERGWTMPMPGAKLWGGMLMKNLTGDANDDPKTPADESVNFYKTYAEGKKKPLMLGETSATLSYRSDLPEAQRAMLSHLWRSGQWNKAEYGWLQTVYGTTAFKDHALLYPIDREYPRMKAIVWFHIAKKETLPVEKITGDKRQIIWFENAYGDYRVGGGVAENGERPFLADEMNLFRRLTDTPYFLTKLQ